MLKYLTNAELLAVWDAWVSRDHNTNPEVSKSVTEKLDKEINGRCLPVPKEPGEIGPPLVHVDDFMDVTIPKVIDNPEDDYKPCTGDC